MKLSHLMRTTYQTDATDDEPDYLGSFSSSFPTPNDERHIMNVDWSRRGEVEVTWLISGESSAHRPQGKSGAA